MAEALSASDRSSLSAEQGSVNMAVGGVLIFDDGPGLEREAVIERMRQRMHLIPRYRQRLEHPVGALVSNPVWVDDTSFDLGWHVHSAHANTDAELAEFAGNELSRRLDRNRPLWELMIVHGLEGGRAAVIPKMHHALVDGVAAIDIGTIILDPSPEPMELEAPDGDWAPRRYDRRRHLARLAAEPMFRGRRLFLDGAARALTTGADPRRAAGDLRRATELVAELAGTRPSAPMTALNQSLGPNRRIALVAGELATLRAAGKASGGTVNDAILAAVTGMLRQLLPDLDVRPVALVPVSVRREGDEGGNHISTVLVDLPIELDDPGERIAALSETTRALKSSSAVRAGALLVGASGWAPPLVSSTLARLMSGVLAFNVVVSNLPGPQAPFFLNGQQLRAVHPIVPLNPANQRLSVGVVSYDGGVYFGLNADRDLEPGVEVAAQALREALAALAAA